MNLALYVAGVIGVVGATHAKTTVVTPGTVVIPQVGHASKTVLHHHGLVPVEVTAVPPQVIPSAVALSSSYSVSAPRKGRVVDQSTPTYFCKKEGFVLDGQTCVRTDAAAVQYVCPHGYTASDDQCVRSVALSNVCPAGYTPREEGCGKVVTAAPIPVCPNNSYETGPGKCERQIPASLVPTCPEGFLVAGNECQIHSYVDAQAYCPETFTFSNGLCIKEETYDCTDHHNQVYGAGAVTAYYDGHSHGHGHGHKRQLTHVHYESSHDSSPVATECHAKSHGVALASRPSECHSETVPAVVVQPTKTQITVQKTCTRVTSTALVFACEQGHLVGQRCLVKSNVPATMVCHFKGDVNGCYTTAHVHPDSVCPDGYTRDCSSGICRCAAIEATAYVQSCPTGYTMNGDSCVSTQQVRVVCPAGYTHQGDTCIRVLREPADCQFQVTYECDHSLGNCH